MPAKRSWSASSKSPAFSAFSTSPAALVVRVGIPARRLLQPAQRDAGLERIRLDLREELVDRLVTLRGDRDALPAIDQVRDEPRPGPRLPRSGRALDEEVRALDVADELAHRLEPLALDALPAERWLAAQELLEVRVAAVARAQRVAQAHQRLLLVDRLPRASRDEPGRQRHLLEPRAPRQSQRPGDRVDLHDLSRATHRHRIEDRVSDVELLLLHRKAEAVHE